MAYQDTHEKHRLLRTVAKKFRVCLEKANQEELTNGLRSFPRGACGHATLLLGTFLSDRGFGQFNYVCGERGYKQDGDWTSHAWLQKGNLVVDITADQFDGDIDKVIVAENSDWHSQFTVEDEHPACYRKYDEHTRQQLDYAYQKIVGIYDAT